jgi:energy-coupling factor transporter transmembrane protein EcfT
VVAVVSGRNFVAQMIGYAIILGIGAVITLALGEYWVAFGLGTGSVISTAWARWKHRRLSRLASGR